MVSQQQQSTDQVSKVVPAELVSGSHAARTDPAWGLPSHHFSRWPAFIAICAAIVLYYVLPENLIQFKPRQLFPVLEALLLVPILLTNVRDRWRRTSWKRPVFMVLIVLVTASNFTALGLLVFQLTHGHANNGRELLRAGVDIWVTNIIIFALWYWELDRGGPIARLLPNHPEPDFLFPQMTTPEAAPKDWAPSFMDYLYVSFTNSTAFSPTDTMPLTEWAKLLMGAQTLASLLTIALVGARAVNILN